ncbi:MAG: Fe-S cluster assembly ATPase SufC [candidate division FCPU426 bacterium]
MEDLVLKVEDLHVNVGDKEILKGVDLEVRRGEIHALMGPNGSGKSTLSNAMLGHPNYTITSGRVFFKGEDVTAMPTDEKARKGMFLAFQYPVAIPGVTVTNFLRAIVKARQGAEMPARDFRKFMTETMAALDIDPGFAKRYVNDGFSGGEKKRCEILQMAMLKPELAVLDETDSGLDIDALRIVCDGINRTFHPGMGMLIITHYQRMLNYTKPHVVHILVDGRIVATGGGELVDILEKEGYDRYTKVKA